MLTGIFAANKVTINMGGSVTFNATDVYARITGNVSNDMSKPENLDVTYSADETPQGDDTVWNNLNLVFDDQATPIEIAITVENLSSTNTLRVNLDDKVTSSVANFNKAVTVDVQPYTNLEDITLQTNGSEDDSITFVITLSVEEKNNTIVADLNFQINLYDQNYVGTVELTDFVFDGYGTLISYTGTDTDVSIPSSYSMIGQPTQQTLSLNSSRDIQSNMIYIAKMTRFNYVYNEKSTYYEDAGAFMADFSTIKFPCEIEYDDYSKVTFTSGDDVNVTEIKGAFYMNTTTKTVSIPSSVTNLGCYAFSLCTGIKSVTIPYGVTSIGDYAFQSCYAIESVIIPNSVTSIGSSAFSNSVLESVTIKATTPPEYYDVFYYCNMLTEIYVPSASVDAYKSAEGWSQYSDIIKGIEII